MQSIVEQNLCPYLCPFTFPFWQIETIYFNDTAAYYRVSLSIYPPPHATLYTSLYHHKNNFNNQLQSTKLPAQSDLRPGTKCETDIENN